MKKVLIRFKLLILFIFLIQFTCISVQAQVLNYDKELTDALSNLQVSRVAPKKFYRLIRIQLGVDHSYAEKMQTILDLIWSEPIGKYILTTLMNADTPINITRSNEKAYEYRYKYSNSSFSSVIVNIPYTYIDNFNDSSLCALKRIYNLQVFLHEFGHAFINIKNPNDVNSIEEELGVSMIGFNIANKIITNKYLDKDQTERYSMSVLMCLLSDDHKNLPVYSGFNYSIRKFGISVPYTDVYMNIPSMYRKLLAAGKISPVQSFCTNKK